MLWKVLKPSAVLVAFVLTMAVSIAIIRYGMVATAKGEEKVCGTVVGLQGQVAENKWQVTVGDDGHAVIIPTRQAYRRLAVGKEFTFVYRQGELVAIGDGNLCNK